MNQSKNMTKLLLKALHTVVPICLLIVVGCTEKTDGALTADELIELANSATTTDDDALAILVDVEQDAAEITSKKGTTAVYDKSKDKIENKEKDVEEGLKALREDLGEADDVVKLMDACFQISKNLKSSAEASIKSGSKDIPALKNAPGRDTAPWEDCSASIAEKEKQLQKEIDILNKEKKELNKKLTEKRKEFQNETDPEKKQQLLAEVTELEDERDEKQREINKKERQKNQLKILKMFMGLILIAIGAFLGGMDGGLLIGAGIGMMTSSASGEDSSATEDANDQPSAKEADNTPPESVDSEAKTKPAEATAYQKSPQYTVVPVDENSNTAIDGYYLVRRKSDGNYDLMHTTKSDFVRRIEIDKVENVGGVSVLPEPFTIKQMKSVSFRSGGSSKLVKISVVFETTPNKELTLYQENENKKVIWRLTDAVVQ